MANTFLEVHCLPDWRYFFEVSVLLTFGEIDYVVFLVRTTINSLGTPQSKSKGLSAPK